MKVIHEEGSRPIKLWTDDIEEGALQQLKNIAKLPFIAKNGVAAMPDCHWGIGATVGSVIATTRAILPSSVGCDAGCGMVAVRTSLTASDLPDSLLDLRHQIERDIPLGPGGKHQGDAVLSKHFDRLPRGDIRWGLPLILGAASDEGGKRAAGQLGTLGSGNHFIEICLDEDQAVWVMLHSGSRGTGNILGRQFIETAKVQCERYFIPLPDRDLAYLVSGTQEFEDYISAMTWCQDYAAENRRVMMETVLAALERRVKPFTLTMEAVNCHHNYVARENHFGENVYVTRKGAIRARVGDLGIIPSSMGQKSYIVEGLGNSESYCSCSHGAGRAMGRKEARRRFTVADLEAQTVGVECRKDIAIVDEIPASYKDISAVMANQTDLVKVLHTLKAVCCVKGA